MEWRTDALVLRAIDYGENDKILTLLTPSGKVTAGMRGVRKPKAKLGFAAQPFCFAEYVFAARGDRNTVVSAYLHEGFYPLRTDILRYYAACAVAEICDSLTGESVDARAVFIAAIECLKELSLTERDAAETLVTFALIAVREGGYAIDLDGCGVCGGEIGKEPCFDLAAGYFTCDECSSGVRAKPETYEYLRKCSGLSYQDGFTDAGRRALRLLRAYLTEKTESDYPCFKEFLALYAADNAE